MQPVIEYTFLEHYYISPKERYESILCELINHSSAFTKIGGGSFEQIKIQNSSQPDVIVPTSGYSLDFKLMISESLAEFRNLSRPRTHATIPSMPGTAMLIPFSTSSTKLMPNPTNPIRRKSARASRNWSVSLKPCP